VRIDEEDEKNQFYDEVLAMKTDATTYLLGLRKWCKKIYHSDLYYNLGSTLCVFLFEIENKQSVEDNRIWVINGDVPKMYLDSFGATTIKEVLENFCNLAEEWSSNILEGKSLDECFPFD